MEILSLPKLTVLVKEGRDGDIIGKVKTPKTMEGKIVFFHGGEKPSVGDTAIITDYIDMPKAVTATEYVIRKANNAINKMRCF